MTNFAVACLATAVLGNYLKLEVGHGVGGALPSGIYLAMLLLSELRCWPRWTVIALGTGVVAEIGICGESVVHASFDTAGHILGMLGAAWLIRRMCESPYRFDLPRSMFALVILAILPGAAIGAMVEWSLRIFEDKPVSLLAFVLDWTSYSLGALLMTPLVLLILQPRVALGAVSLRRWFEASALTVLLLAATYFTFHTELPLVYLLLPLVLWGVLRFGLPGTVLTVVVLAMMALHFTRAGHGPYVTAGRPVEVSALLVQGFLVLASAGALLLVAINRHRQWVLDKLRRAHAELDAQVVARTAALRESEQALRENEERFRIARAAAKIIVIDWDVQRDELTFSDSPEWLRGPLPDSGKYPLYKDQVHPDDREHFLAVRNRSIETVEGQTVQYRMVRTDGAVLHVESFQTMFAGRDGKAARLVAMHQDITARKQAEIALRESEQRFRALLDAMPEEVRLKDTQGRYVMLNRAAQLQMGRPADEIIGRTVFDFRPHDVASLIDAQEKQVIATARPIVFERNAYVDPDTWREAVLTPILDSTGNVISVLTISRDVSERKLAELEKLREREEQYRGLVEQASDLIYRTNPLGYFTYINTDVAAGMLGYSKEEMLGRHYLDFVHPDQRHEVDLFYRRHFKAKTPHTYHEFATVSKDGKLLWVGQHVNAFIENKQVVYHQAVCRDITERVVAQQALSDSNDKLRQLSARQAELLEAERTRIAHDLHDGIGQSLNLARIKLTSVIEETRANPMQERLREINRIIDDTNAAIRSMEFDLSPPVLRQLGLSPALDWLADEMLRQYGLRVGVSDDGEEKPLSETSQAITFRLIRELLINVVRHAGVKQAHVDTQRSSDSIVVTVSDEGRGFDTSMAGSGLGLVSVRERISYVGGSAAIWSTPEEGTVVTLSIPLAGCVPVKTDDGASKRK